jgi:hypothetical protein
MVAASDRNNAEFDQAGEQLQNGIAEINAFVARKNEILGNQGTAPSTAPAPLVRPATGQQTPLADDLPEAEHLTAG